ncbi:MAG TPA: FGGY-family carbohydrate kinase [Gaiellaceae bacterium]|nr:FGGY-family carbohydrate kinase [Gaiellaceae bacterium]
MTRIVALDVGSSSVRALAYGEDGVAEPGDAHVGYGSYDADLLVDACKAVLAQVGDGDALAISCFWHSLLPLDEHDRPLGPVLTWRHTTGEPPPLDPVGYHARTGCFLHPAYWPAKLRDLEAARYVSFGDYLLLKLAGELRMSVSTATGTGVYDPNRLAWDEETLAAVAVDPARLPPVSDEPVAGVWPALGDGACSNVGAGCTRRGRAAVMVGTSAAARVVYEAASAEARPGLFLYRLDGRRFCEGGALSDGGNLHAWLVATLRDHSIDDLADREPAAHGLVFLPFLGGERSLGWNPRRRGLIHGLSFATTPADIAQAALEGVAYRLVAVLEAIDGLDSVVATGGGLLANPGWLQVLADALGRPVEVSGAAEGSARGTAVVALERLGLPVPEAPVERIVEPRLDRHEIHLEAMAEQRRLMGSQESR